MQNVSKTIVTLRWMLSHGNLERNLQLAQTEAPYPRMTCNYNRPQFVERDWIGNLDALYIWHSHLAPAQVPSSRSVLSTEKHILRKDHVTCKGGGRSEFVDSACRLFGLWFPSPPRAHTQTRIFARLSFICTLEGVRHTLPSHSILASQTKVRWENELALDRTNSPQEAEAQPKCVHPDNQTHWHSSSILMKLHTLDLWSAFIKTCLAVSGPQKSLVACFYGNRS